MINRIVFKQGKNFKTVDYKGHFVGIILNKRAGKYKALSHIDRASKENKSFFNCVLHLLNIDYLSEKVY